MTEILRIFGQSSRSLIAGFSNEFHAACETIKLQSQILDATSWESTSKILESLFMK